MMIQYDDNYTHWLLLNYTKMHNDVLLENAYSASVCTVCLHENSQNASVKECLKMSKIQSKNSTCCYKEAAALMVFQQQYTS